MPPCIACPPIQNNTSLLRIQLVNKFSPNSTTYYVMSQWIQFLVPLVLDQLIVQNHPIPGADPVQEPEMSPGIGHGHKLMLPA